MSHCPLCRTPFNNGVTPIEFSDDEPESESESESDDEILDYNHAMVEAANRGHEALVRSLLNHGANDFNRAMAMAAGEGHANIVNLLRDRMNS